jgi:hypothetical protein
MKLEGAVALVTAAMAASGSISLKLWYEGARMSASGSSTDAGACHQKSA